ncbi:ribonuclease HII [archaeon SCG-AAA382B04]|nr:ribonuclease HII [archaeon SCG-AAA382B04]
MENKKIIGIDEAGKGPVIGPMIVSGVVFQYPKNRDIKKPPKSFGKYGLTDSKKLSTEEINQLSKQIKKTSFSIEIKCLEAPHIDRLREEKTMNKITIDAFSLILKNNDFDIAILDAADVDENRFLEKVKEKIGSKKRIISEHQADERYPVVSAASIISKKERDKRIRDLEKIIKKEIGKGYPTKDTKEFLRKWISENKELPIFCRKSWKTSKESLKNFKQSNLGDYD